MDNLDFCVGHGIHAVVGTTGLDETSASRSVRGWLAAVPGDGVLIAPNFSIGAVLTMQFAQKAAPYFESVEVIELHHPNKADAPSRHRHPHRPADRRRPRRGRRSAAAPDATTTAWRGPAAPTSTASRCTPYACAGLLAHQEVLLGGDGETLTIRHDSLHHAASCRASCSASAAWSS